MDKIHIFAGFLLLCAIKITTTVGQAVDCPAAIATSQSSGVITSPGYPDAYPNEKVCQWVLAVPQGYILVLDFEYIDLEANHDNSVCYDYITVHDGPTASGDVASITTCGTSDPEQFTSTGNNLYIRFVSDPSITGEGFRAVYRTELYEPMQCNATLSASASEEGIIISPGFPERYPDNSLCAWTISAASGAFVSLQITNIGVEGSSGACYDYLEVYDGSSASSTLIGKYCGQEAPDAVVSTGSSLWLLFNSDNTISGAGFRATYQQTGTPDQPPPISCGGTLTSLAGPIVSPAYPNKYPLNNECTWIIQVPESYSIRLEFTIFDLEDPDAASMCIDYLQMRDGADGTAPGRASYCGNSIPPVYTSSGNALWLYFYSDENIAYTGFSATYQAFIAQPTVCDGSFQIITLTSGVFTSPQYPSNYPDLADCSWAIHGTQDSYITLTFTNFDIEPANGQGLCSFDQVKVIEGAHETGPILGSFCGSDIPSLITSSGNVMGIYFTSDNTLVSSGFRAVYTIVQSATQPPATTPPIQCGGTLTASSDAISSPRYPQIYPINTECTWIIQAQVGLVVSAEFLYFDLEESNAGLCVFDSVDIRDGGSMTSPLLRSSCGPTIPAPITSSSNLLWIRFTSDDMNSRTGFRLTYQQIVQPTVPPVPSCGDTLIGSRGEIRSPLYPGAYPSNTLCTWIIQAPEGSAIKLVFLDFDLQDEVDFTCVDILDVTDGASRNAPIVGSYCGSSVPPTFTSSRNRLWVRFESDSSISGNGFTAIYNHVVDTDVQCGGQLSGSGTISSPRYPQAYPLTSECTWVITVPAGQIVTLSVVYFDIEDGNGQCEFDYLEVRDGLTEFSPVIGRYCGSSIASSISSTSNSMWVMFESDGSFAAPGFTIDYAPQIMATEEPPIDDPTCGGMLTQTVGIIQSPRYGNQYPRNVECQWTIQASQGYAIVLEFVGFDLEEEVADTCFDGLQVRDGSSRFSPLISVHCGSTLPGPISSTGNSMWLQFYSDDDTAGTGFQATFRQIEINECSSNPCRNGATCVNRINQFHCDCVAGYTGTYCEEIIPEGEECASVPCAHGATCYEGMGSFYCVCIGGWQGPTCLQDIDECLSNPCFNGAFCVNGQNQYTCRCTVGFHGDRCETAVEPCESNPCSNGAICYNGNDAFICVCQNGWAGGTCTQDVDECASDPCQHGGLCTNGRNQYSCQCLPGFRGNNCQTDINECLSAPCMNGGVCVDGANQFTCDCMPGFTGLLCNNEVDECDSSPCKNGAICYNGDNSYYCQCAPGWQGATCTQDLNECLSSPCQNGGICMNGRNRFTCECQPGYTGASCQTDVNECVSGPCRNGGTCTDGQNQFTCDCIAGFIGEQCQTEVDACESNPCANGGQCYNGGSTFLCQCRGGWEGPTCLQDINECFSNPCQNGGICINEQNQFRCECTPGNSGTMCQIDIDECASHPCQNGGTCFQAPGFFVCQCVAGWVGDTCSEDINECSSNPCQNGGICVNRQNQFTCQCAPGYQGIQCESDIDECISRPCLQNGICINGRNQFSCDCPDGYSGNVCQINVDECSGNPCANGGICVDGSNTFVCQCLEGWQGDTCEQDVNECSSNPCQNGAICVNRQNRFTCECMQGFQGTRCETDVNECLSSPCQNGGMCINERNQFRCECTSGYLGTRCQTDIDECSSNPCQNEGTCVNGENQFTCQCPPGYAGLYCERAVDECQSNPCENGGRCFDEAGFFICQCMGGWQGSTCADDIDECLSGPCRNGAICTNGRNQFTCECVPGFQGVQCETNTYECSSNPCQNGATCVDQVNQYTCICLPGFIGTTCQIDVDECSSNPCQNEGTCVDAENQYTCNCQVGYSGPSCEIDTNECSSSPCQNGATCIEGINQYTCNCVTGFIGPTCQTDINECASNPCVNGDCVDGVNQYTCTCLAGYFGPRCDVDIDECVSVPCQNGGTCINMENGYQCDCMPGYQGSHCHADINECSSNPCQNGANCVNGENQFTCQCAPGFQGVTCQNDINECSSRPCQNGATCKDGHNSFICNCAPGFQGTYCHADINECLSLPCQNGGVCQNGLNRFRCDCAAGYTGELCEEDFNECSSDPCLNGATCISGLNQFSCECSSGFSGNLCQINLDECSSNPCLNGGTCDDGDNEFICNCVVGFFGRRCESDLNECSSSPCQNGGTCYDGVDLYRCVCVGGWTGQNCQQDIDECQSSPCKNGAMCTNGRNQYRCTCTSGYQGTDCDTDVNECSSNPCLNGATCRDEVDFYTCECRPGYQGSFCETDINECESSPCANGALCFDGVNTYSCVCSGGWAGFDCTTDIDECGARSPCLNGAICIDGRNEFTCQCADGYSGRLCEREINECSSSPCANNGGCIDEINGFYCACLNGYTGPTCTTDVDECTSSPCLNGGTCVDGQDRFICNCKPGFQGTLCEVNFDECGSWPCMNGGSCRNEENQFICNCLPGFTGTHCEIDIDDCSTVPCNNEGTCIDGINRYQCRCLDGWTGLTCLEDIDECSSAPCQNGATCMNGQNQFTCQCVPGYQGIQCESDINDCASLPCHNGGLCRDEVNKYSCQCASGWYGVQCDQDRNECASEPCQNNGICSEPQPNVYQCRCMPGWDGPNCERDINECASEPCANGAMCHNQESRFVCTCVPGWQGVRCDEVVPSPSPGSCGDTLTDPSGELQSPGFPNIYPSNLNCVWLIQAPRGFVVEMEFTHLDVEKLEDCVDLIKVSESADIESDLIGTYCGDLDTPSDPIPSGPITSDGSFLWIQLLTNPTGENTGFKINYRQIADPPPEFHECAGETINIDLPEGEATVLVSWTEPTASDHLGNRILVIQVTGPSSGIRLGPGVTELVYEASTDSGSRATCEFAYEVHDTEAPIVLECPDQRVIIKTLELPVTLDLSGATPTFSDNVGIDTIVMEPDLETLDEFGEYVITYIAQDAGGNEATCDVTVEVILQEVCPELEIPPNTLRSCSDDNTLCLLQCKDSFVFPDRIAVSTNGLVLTCIANEWVNMETNANMVTLPACARVNSNGVKWGRQDTVRYQIPADAQCVDIQDNIQEALMDELQNNNDFKVRCSAVDGTRCDIDNVIIECNNARRRKRQTNGDAEIATGTYVISAERDDGANTQALETVLAIPVTILVPEELRVDYPQDDGQIILTLLDRSSGEKAVVCSEGKEPAALMCVDCPPGTSYSIDDATCLPCPIGSYQDDEGQMKCKTCATNYITESNGAFDSSLCSKYVQPTEPSTTDTNPVTVTSEPFVGSMIFYIVVGAGGGLLLLFIIITVCCCTSGKRKRRPEEFIDAYKEDNDNDYADTRTLAEIHTSHDVPFASNVAFYEHTPGQYDHTPAQYDLAPGQYDETPGHYNLAPGQYDQTPVQYDNPMYRGDHSEIYDTIHENEFSEEDEFEISTL